MSQKTNGWFGVDLDGTLAYYDGWKGASHIGEPIPAMLEQVKALIANGETVKIFTARVGPRKDAKEHPMISEQRDPADNPEAQRALIEAWCEKHVGQKLEVTATKDFSMVALFDDRAVQVVLNEGVPVAEDAMKGLKAAEELYFMLAGNTLTHRAIASMEKLRLALGIPDEMKVGLAEEKKIVEASSFPKRR
jgi:hypothetical protein